MREWFTHNFLTAHLPGAMQVGSGHILYEEEASKQQDVVVYLRDSLALPIGGTGLFLPEKVLACIEVKSSLSKEHLVNDVANKFSSLKHPQPLKVLITDHFKDHLQYRGYVGKWATEGGLSAAELPDLIVIADNAPIIRGSGLTVLEGSLAPGAPEQMYKYGTYEGDKWLGLALLVFELAQRAGTVDWRAYLEPVLPSADTAKPLPDRKL